MGSRGSQAHRYLNVTLAGSLCPSAENRVYTRWRYCAWNKTRDPSALFIYHEKCCSETRGPKEGSVFGIWDRLAPLVECDIASRSLSSLLLLVRDLSFIFLLVTLITPLGISLLSLLGSKTF